MYSIVVFDDGILTYLLNFLHPLGVVRCLHALQSTIMVNIVYTELGFTHTSRGAVSTVGSPSWYLEGYMIWGCDLILPGYGATSTLVRGATLAASWLHVIPGMSPSQSATQWGWGFHTVRGAIDPRDFR